MAKIIYLLLLGVFLGGCRTVYVPRVYYSDYSVSLKDIKHHNIQLNGYYCTPLDGGKYFKYIFFYESNQYATITLPKDYSDKPVTNPDSLLSSWTADKRFNEGLIWEYYSQSNENLFLYGVDYPWPGIFLIPYSIPVIKSEFELKQFGDTLKYLGKYIKIKRVFNLIFFRRTIEDTNEQNYSFKENGFRPNPLNNEFEVLQKSFLQTNNLNFGKKYRKKVIEKHTK